MVALPKNRGKACRSKVAGAPPGPRQKDQRRAALLDAAASLLVEKGTAATTIDEISVRAGVAKGTFYHYFQDRAAMLEALRRRYSEQYAGAADTAMAACADGDWDGLFTAWVHAVVEAYLASYALHDAIFHDAAVCERCVMSEEPVVRSLAELITRGIAAGHWATEDVTSAAVCMFHGIHGLLDEALATEADTSRIAPTLTRIYAKMLDPRCAPLTPTAAIAARGQ